MAGIPRNNDTAPVPTGQCRTFTSLFAKAATVNPNMVDFQSLKNPKKVTFFNGTPELEYEDDEFEDLIAPHKMNLVGKFSYGRPKMEILREDFKKIGFKGGYDLGLMNPRHVLIWFELEEDYQRCWITSIWNIGKFQMRIMKWQPGFKFEEDPPIVLIWVSLHELPLEWTHPMVLYSIASAVGKPLQVDTPTLNLTRPSVARFCVEVDLMKDLPKSIRIGKKGKKYEQHYTYEYVPSYCPACCKIGHKEVDCKKGKGVIKEDLKTAEHVAAERISTGAKGGLRLQQKKVTWGSKQKGKKDELQVTIIQENPLIVKGVQTAVEKSQPAGTLKLAATLIFKPAKTHAGESTSGLSALEKRAIPVDIIDSQPLDSGCHKVGNVDGVQKKVIAQGNDGSFDPEKRAVDGSKKDVIAQGDDGFSLQSNQLDQDSAADEALLNIDAPLIQSNKSEASCQLVHDDQTKSNNQDEGFAKLAYPDDSLVMDLNETDDDDIAQGECWFEGDKDEAVLGGKAQGVFSTKKKRGRKSKEERGRRIRKEASQRRLRALVRIYRVGFLVILEPMLTIDKLDAIRRELFSDFAFSSSTSKIWVFHNKFYTVNRLQVREQAMHFEVGYVPLQTNFLVTAVYAMSQKVERRSLWSLEEYSGNSIQDYDAIDEFNQCIEANNLMEAHYVGDEFTWGGTRTTGWVSKKLDHILFSQEWMEIFPRVSIELLSRTISDHSPLLLRFDTQLETRPRCFRFQKMWLRRGDFKNIVKASWLQPANRFGMMAFSIKLCRLKLVLKEWNKTHFGDVFENLRNAEERVKELEVLYDHSGHENDSADSCVGSYSSPSKCVEGNGEKMSMVSMAWGEQRKEEALESLGPADLSYF
ncbi:OLC1v1000801C1 [Oldenlandia corymbosa var. corymbosa]|uniref:OLC1v1000801C1 n=1 Tax=Oldenlandia corymbosa var. corymbosa TaxID=529605 RepID=A0AAV1D6A6_OLDCO|nr:OLC1v1000801C1 [Oldenlandia corymbosa var. corymbosa]